MGGFQAFSGTESRDRRNPIAGCTFGAFAMNAASKQAKPAPALSILVADDEMDTVQTLAAILADEGHAVYAIRDSSLVLDAVRRLKPNVCILDIEMPGPDGYAIAREIVKEFDAKNQPRPL